MARLLVVAVAAIMFPLVVEANAGTPLIWGATFHLLLGNCIIGIFEGWLLHLILPNRRLATCFIPMVTANYFSAWMGAASMRFWLPLVDWGDVGYIKVALACAVVVAWLFTIVAEFPFVWWMFRNEKNRFKRTVKASFIIQSASYVILFVWYAVCSETSLMSADVVDISSLKTPADVTISFVGDNGKGYEGSLHLRNWKEVDAEGIVNVATNDHRYICCLNNDSEYTGDWMAYASAGAIGWPDLSFRNKKSGELFRVGIETPLITWDVRMATQLSDGKVVFQFGKNQICIADPERKCVAVVARGKCPVVKTMREAPSR